MNAFKQFKSRKYGVYNEGTAQPKLTAAVSMVAECKSACPGVRHSPEAPFASRTYAAETTKQVVLAAREGKEKRRKEGGRAASGRRHVGEKGTCYHAQTISPVRLAQAPAFSVRVPQRARRAVSRPKHARTHARTRHAAFLAFCSACDRLIAPPPVKALGDITYMLHNIILNDHAVEKRSHNAWDILRTYKQTKAICTTGINTERNNVVQCDRKHTAAVLMVATEQVRVHSYLT